MRPMIASLHPAHTIALLACTRVGPAEARVSLDSTAIVG